LTTPHKSPTPTLRGSRTRTVQPTNTPRPGTQTLQPIYTSTRPPNATNTSRPTNTRDPYPYP
jgi:hypothetical protein